MTETSGNLKSRLGVVDSLHLIVVKFLLCRRERGNPCEAGIKSNNINRFINSMCYTERIEFKSSTSKDMFRQK